MTNNIFFSEYKTPHQTIPFDKIKLSDYKPAFLEGFKRHSQEIDEIVNSKETPTFENTIVAYEQSGELLSRVQNCFYNLLEAESSDEMQDLANEISPIETDHYNNITLNEKLFERIKSVYQQKDKLSLTIEQQTLLDKIYESFENHGATLDSDKKKEFRELSKKSSLLQLKYGQNLLNATNAYQLVVEDKSKLDGLPDSTIEAASQRAKEKKLTGYVFDLSYPSYVPFMKYCKDRELRKQLYLARNQKSFGGEFDNTEIIKELVNVRLKIAKLLGYSCYADSVLKDRMAENKENVYNLLNELLEKYRPIALQELKEVEHIAEEIDSIKDLKGWDWSYYSNILRNRKFEINDEVTRPYLPLEQVKKGVFGLAEKLYGIKFELNKSIPIYHNEVEAYEVFDENRKYIGIFYADFHPRKSKQGGAWMTEFQCQHRNEKGEDIRPHVSIVMNLTRPTESKPALLSIDELSTFLHEFGHALHGLLSQVTYESIAGTNVYRDFVELPSQLMENWATEKEFLDGFASHYQSGEKIPADIVTKIKAESNFNTGYATLRQLSFGFLDMAWHSITTEFTGNVKDFEQKAWQKALIMPDEDNTLMSSQFSHIFDGGYAAGYYSYKWAEVLDADAFSVFKSHGIFDKETATKFRKEVLEKGGSEHPMTLYKRFRGQKPTIDALLKRNNIK